MILDLEYIKNFTDNYKDTDLDGLVSALSDYIGSEYAIPYQAGNAGSQSNIADPKVDTTNSMGDDNDPILLALKALGIPNGSAVFVPEFSDTLSTNVLENFEVIPIFVDKSDYLMDCNALKEAIASAKESEKPLGAVVFCDTFGRPADFYDLKIIARDAGLPIIEDARTCFGGAVDLTNTGIFKVAATFGLVGITAYCFFTEDKAIYDALKDLVTPPTDEEIVNRRTYLAMLRGETAIRRALPHGPLLLAYHTVYDFYDDALSTYKKKGMRLPSRKKELFLACPCYPIAISHKAISRLFSEIEGIVDSSLNNEAMDLVSYSQTLDLAGFACRVLSFGDETIICLPTTPGMTEEDAKSIANCFKGL